MIDWVSWVMIGFLVFFFGKAEYIRGDLNNYKEHGHDTSEEKHHTDHLQKEKDRYMQLFAILFVIFLLRESMLSS